MSAAIVVVAYNRDRSLLRLLESLAAADYRGASDVPLVISIDKSDNSRVALIAENFEWRFGQKRIVKYGQRLGLRKHVLNCGDLTTDYDGIVMLEDDLFVSRGFYRYACESLSEYRDCTTVGGVALYSYRYVDTIAFPFFPVIPRGDVYFVRFPSSSGQGWTRGQWASFRDWLDSGRESDCVELDDLLPATMRSWPLSSWKKSFARYLVDVGKYIAYPSMSFTTNMGDAGNNWASATAKFQVQLSCGDGHLELLGPEEATRYDQFFEIHPESLRSLSVANELSDHVEMDLYGTKPACMLKGKIAVSSKPIALCHSSFGFELLPHELNIANMIEGDIFAVGEGSKFQACARDVRRRLLKHQFALLGGSDLIGEFWRRMWARLHK